MILLIFHDFLVFDGVVGVVSVETNGGGPLGHPVSPGSVSRLGGSQKSIFSCKFCQNLRLPPMCKLRTQISAKEGQIRSKSHYEKIET